MSCIFNCSVAVLMTVLCFVHPEPSYDFSYDEVAGTGRYGAQVRIKKEKGEEEEDKGGNRKQR